MDDERRDLERTLPTNAAGSPASTPTTGDTPTLVGPCVPLPRVETPPAGRRLGAYEILEECGRGGMGIVYKARQVELNRLVALKVMIAGEYATPLMLERFQREARAAAKLRHPNLVEIYDVSREGEKHYFTMRYVDGTPLSDLIRRKEVPPRRALEIVRKVALALDHAHSQGVIHRDVKPANILVDRAGEPHLTDFGLARDVSDGDLTLPGTSLGTPSYSAPEQVSGEHAHADARSDVYAIGATLYEALAGRPPFPGDTAWEIVVRVLSREPQPIRELNPSVHRDIETICLKAIEKEPSRRYATAGEMAEDIRRYMDGEPIVARTASLTDRAWKRIRRNPLVSALAAVALLAGALAGWAGWQGHKRDLEAEGARRAMVEARLRELSRSGRALVDAALARRSTGDLKGCARYAKELAEPVEELIRLAPNLAEPWYYRGRMEAATGVVEEAERSQSRAVELASRTDATPGSREVLLLARYERGILRAGFYQRALGEAQVQLLRARASEGEGAERRIPEAAEVEAERPEIAKMKRGSIEDLDAVTRAQGEAEGLDARIHAAQGIRESLEGDPRGEAGAHLQRAIDLDPYLQEVYLTLAILAEEKKEWEKAASWCEKGIAVDRGLFAYYERLVVALQLAAEEQEAGGRDGSPLRARAIAALDRALALDDRRAKLWNLRAELEWLGACARARSGGDPSEGCGRAIDGARRALAIDAGSVEAEITLGNGLATLADWKVTRGEDPSEEYRLGVDANERALALDPESSVAAANLADIHQEIADRRLEREEDPSAECARAIEGYERALRLDPRFAGAANNLGNSHMAIADWKRGRGEDPVAEYEGALAAFQIALSVRPRHANTLANEGTAHQSIGEWRLANGADPTEAFEHAREAFKKALSINPRHAQANINLPNLDSSLAQWLAARGQDPKEAAERAIAGYRRAIDAFPTAWQPHANLGLLLEDLGRRDEAIAAYEAALRMCPDQPQVKKLLDRARGR